MRAEFVRSVTMDRLRWEVGYPEMFAVQGVSMTLVILTYAAVFDLAWTHARAPSHRSASGAADLAELGVPAGHPLHADARFGRLGVQRLVVGVEPRPVRDLGRLSGGRVGRRGSLWLVGLLVPVALAVGWLAGRSRLDSSLLPQSLSTDLIMGASVLVIPILGCLACWGIEALARSVRTTQVAAT